MNQQEHLQGDYRSSEGGLCASNIGCNKDDQWAFEPHSIQS